MTTVKETSAAEPVVDMDVLATAMNNVDGEPTVKPTAFGSTKPAFGSTKTEVDYRPPAARKMHASDLKESVIANDTKAVEHAKKSIESFRDANEKMQKKIFELMHDIEANCEQIVDLERMLRASQFSLFSLDVTPAK